LNSSLITEILVACVTILLIWTAQKGRPTFSPDDGALRFRYSLAIRGLAIIMAFVVPAGVVLLAMTRKMQTDDPWTVPAICALFAALGAPVWWEAFRFSLIICPKGLDCSSPWKGRHFIAWNEITQVSFSSINSWFVIKSATGRSFRVSLFVSGIPEFLAQCERYLPPAALTKARHGYAEVGREFPNP
jgi:hypothetical protein